MSPSIWTAHTQSSLTRIADVLRPVEGVVLQLRAEVDQVRGVFRDIVQRSPYALMPQVSHEELQSDQSKHAQTEDRQDHHVWQLLHRLDKSAHDGLQPWGTRSDGHKHSRCENATYMTTQSCFEKEACCYYLICINKSVSFLLCHYLVKPFQTCFFFFWENTKGIFQALTHYE